MFSLILFYVQEVEMVTHTECLVKVQIGLFPMALGLALKLIFLTILMAVWRERLLSTGDLRVLAELVRRHQCLPLKSITLTLLGLTVALLTLYLVGNNTEYLLRHQTVTGRVRNHRHQFRQPECNLTRPPLDLALATNSVWTESITLRTYIKSHDAGTSHRNLFKC